MKMTKSHHFNASAASCWAMFSDPASHVAKFEGMGHHGVTIVEKKKTKKSLSLTITREVDIDGIPGFARKFIKSRNTVVSVDHWVDNGDGTYSGEFTIDTKGTPIAISGTTHVAPVDDAAAYTVEVEVKVNVPLVGGKLEGFAKGIVDRQLNDEFRLADEWLASH